MKAEPSHAASWDLTSKISPYLDLHMMFPLLEYIDSLISKGSIAYSHEDVAKARLSLLTPTHMVDYAMEIYKELHNNDIPAEMEDQKAQVLATLETLKNDEGCKAFTELCKNTELRQKLLRSGEWNIPELSKKKELGINLQVIETYRKLSKFKFDCGDYQTASIMLTSILSLYAMPPLPKEDDDVDHVDDDRADRTDKSEKTGNPKVYHLTSINTDLLQILWGKLACEILIENWDEASIALTAVKLSIEHLVYTHKMTHLEALTQRTWLLHWSLFVFWNNSAKGLDAMVDLFFSEKYLQAITTNAPHLLRYLTVAVLLVKRRVAKTYSRDGRSSGAEGRRLMKDLVRLMQNCEYSDPIVEFVDCLCVKFDFEGAQTKLAECEGVLETDFFLTKRSALFMEEARVFVFENYCQIHDKVDLKVLGAKLAMDQEAAEHWIVDLIRNALLDAKIDSEQGCVVMSADNRSVYEQVMEKTRDLNLRSAGLAQNLENFVANVRKSNAKKAREALEEEE
jgi:translation initiation factor 3 subunit E